MGRPRKSKSSKGSASAPAVDDDKKFFVHAHERDTVFGLDDVSDNDADTSTNVVSAPTRKSNRNKKLKGHDLVGTLDDLANADHVFDLDLPSDSDVSDEDTSSKARRDYVLPEEDDEGTGVRRSGWGKRRGVFYNADDTFADDEAAKLEEQEAQRLRKERLNKLKEEDFLDGAFGTLVGSSGTVAATASAATGALSAVDAADTMEIVEQRPRSEMSKDEILELLATSSPDLLEFILEYQSKLEDLRDALAPMYALAQRMEPEGSPVRTYLQTKYFTVLGFLLNVTFYLALYAKGVPRRDITRHPVVGVLVQLKRQLDAIEKVENDKPWLAEQLEPIIAAIEDMDELEMGVEEYVQHVKKELEREMKEEEEDEDEDEDEDEEMADDSEFDGSDEDAMSEDEEGLASDLDAMDIDSDAEDGEMPSHPPSKVPVKRKRSAAAASSNNNDDDSDASDLDAALASLPAKKRKRLAAHLAAVADADDDFEALKQDAKQASRRQKQRATSSPAPSSSSNAAAAQEADFDETAGDANYGEQRSAFASMMPKKSLKKIVQSVQTAAKSKKAVSADSDVAKQSRKAAQLNAHLSKEAMDEADREADVFSDGDQDDEPSNSKKAKAAAAPKGNFNEIGINMDKVDPMRPISSLVEARAKKLAIKKDKVAKKVAAREGISVDEARKQVKFDGDSDDDADMNDMSKKREASYKILKNKGLTPKRKKEDRNPRVKHRRKFETKMKKLKTVKRMVTDLKSGYQGELTGIKTHLTRQVNLK